MATAAKVSLQEYLNTSYHPDVEYIDGELKEKSVVGYAHGRTQTLLSAWFWQYEDEWDIECAVEVRTQTSPDHVRLPDFVVVVRENNEATALTKPPLVAIEVLSPTDTYKNLKLRASDLESMGVLNIWLIDPKARTAEVWRNGEWYLLEDTRLQATESPIFLDLAWVWQQMDKRSKSKWL